MIKTINKLREDILKLYKDQLVNECPDKPKYGIYKCPMCSNDLLYGICTNGHLHIICECGFNFHE